MKPLFAKSIAEAIGTFAIVLFGCGSVAVATDLNQPTLLNFVPLIFGLTVSFMIYAVGHISGAHFNPAVTFAFASVKRFSWREVPAYWTAQTLGALAACFLLLLLIPGISTFAATTPSIPVSRALLLEITITFFLMFVIKAVATDSRAVGIMAGAAIGITVSVGAFFGGPLTGGSMNPARSIAPAIFEHQFTDLWIYIVGPLIGATLGAFCYRFIRCEPDSETSDAKGCC